MDNAFKIKKGLIVNASGSTAVDIQGNSGQLFSITDSLTGVLMSVNDVSGLPILEVSDTNRVKMGTFGAEGLIVEGSSVILPNISNNAADILTIGSNNRIGKRTAAEILNDIGAQAALTNPITGTGTTNFLSKFTSGTTLGNSQIFDNGTNIGIGTNSPDRAIHLVDTNTSSGYTTGAILGSGNNLNLYQLHVNSNSNATTESGILISHTVSGNTAQWGISTQRTGSNVGNLIFRTRTGGSTSAEVMRMDSSGNVSIGTTTTSHVLRIQGTPRIDSTGQTPSKLTVGVIEEYIASPEIENPAILAEPDVWLRININGTNYVVPAYAAT